MKFLASSWVLVTVRQLKGFDEVPYGEKYDCSRRIYCLSSYGINSKFASKYSFERHDLRIFLERSVPDIFTTQKIMRIYLHSRNNMQEM